MAQRISFFLKAGYRDDAKPETSKPDWIVNQEWNDMPIDALELFERTLHQAEGALIEASVAYRRGDQPKGK